MLKGKITTKTFLFIAYPSYTFQSFKYLFKENAGDKVLMKSKSYLELMLFLYLLFICLCILCKCVFKLLICQAKPLLIAHLLNSVLGKQDNSLFVNIVK